MQIAENEEKCKKQLHFVIYVLYYILLYYLSDVTISCIRGVVLKTLLVHCSGDENVAELCRKSAARDIDVLELRELSNSSSLVKKISNFCGRAAGVPGSYDNRVEDYDKIIIACDGCLGGVYPVVNAFIEKHDLRAKDVSCVVFGEGLIAKRASDALRVCVSLSGGTIRRVVSVPRRSFVRDEEALLYYVRHEMVV